MKDGLGQSPSSTTSPSLRCARALPRGGGGSLLRLAPSSSDRCGRAGALPQQWRDARPSTRPGRRRPRGDGAGAPAFTSSRPWARPPHPFVLLPLSDFRSAISRSIIQQHRCGGGICRLADDQKLQQRFGDVEQADGFGRRDGYDRRLGGLAARPCSHGEGRPCGAVADGAGREAELIARWRGNHLRMVLTTLPR